jgi:apolipoprotein N-acyltransferase
MSLCNLLENRTYLATMWTIGGLVVFGQLVYWVYKTHYKNDTTGDCLIGFLMAVCGALICPVLLPIVLACGIVYGAARLVAKIIHVCTECGTER